MMMHFDLPDGKRLVLIQRESNGPVEARVLGPDHFGNHQYPTLSVSTISASDMVALVLPQEPLKYYEFQTSNYNRTIYYNNFYTSREIETPEIGYRKKHPKLMWLPHPCRPVWQWWNLQERGQSPQCRAHVEADAPAVLTGIL